MASLYAKPCVDNALADVGYQSDGKWNKYAERLDECDFFTGCGKKNGAVDYCAIAVCYWLFMNILPEDLSDDEKKWATHYFIYQSDTCCTAAGCTQQSGVYKDNDAWYTDPKDLERGDQVFFQKSNGAIYHTGLCTGWDEDGAYVTEANVEGGKTLTRFYPYSEFGNKIAGFGRPRYDGWEIESNNTQDDDVVDEPEKPTTDNKGECYEVCVNSWLNVRDGCGKDHFVVDKLRNGETVKVYEIRDGWGRISDNMDIWVCMDYLQKV